MPYLPVDTAVTVIVGPLIDNSDFKTQETAIAYNAAGMSCDLLKNSGTATAKVDLVLTTGGTSDFTQLGSAYAEIEITAAQNDTEGTLQVVGVCTGVLPFESPVYTVVPVAVYNSLVLGTDKLAVDAQEISSDSTAADDLELAIEALGTDNKALISTDAQDLSATLDVNTKTITAGIIANATFASDVGSTAYATNIIELAVRKVLDELNLDHLAKVACDGNEISGNVIDQSIIASMLAVDGDISDYNDNTDSQEALGVDVDAAIANQVLVLDDIVDIKGTGFVKDTDSLVDLAHIGADADTLETLSDQIGLAATAAAVAVVDGNVDTLVTGVNVLTVKSQALGTKVGSNFNLFFQNATADIAKVVDDVGIDSTGMATAANQVLMLADLAEIEGAGFDTLTDSLVMLAQRGDTGYDLDDLYNALATLITGTPDGWYTLRYQVKDGAGNAIENAHCFVSTDLGGTTDVWHGYTDPDGYVFLACSATTGYVWTSHPRYSFTNPDTETFA